MLVGSKMRVALFSVGSRGDAEPFASLIHELLYRYNSPDSDCSDSKKVTWFLQESMQAVADPFLDHSGFDLQPLPFGSQDFYSVTKMADITSKKYPQHPDSRLMKHVKSTAVIMGELVLPCFENVLKILQKYMESGEACVLVTCAFTRPLALLLGRLLDIPVVLIHLQPLLPNCVIPSYRTSRSAFVNACCLQLLGKDASNNQALYNETDDGSNVETYWRIEHALEQVFLCDQIATICEQWGIPMISWQDLQKILTGNNPSVWIVNSFSEHLVPSVIGTPNLGPHILDVGPLADAYVPRGIKGLDSKLEAFLNSNKPGGQRDDQPICVGYGSMPVTKPTIVIQAIRVLRCRAVVVGPVWANILGTKGPRPHPAVENGWIHVIGSTAVPYALLLPHCSAMLCHGGMGVVQACLRAGKPCIIDPQMGDQFAMAELVSRLGYGIQVGTRGKELSVEDIVFAVTQAPRCREACQELSRSICENDCGGSSELRELLSRLVEAKEGCECDGIDR